LHYRDPDVEVEKKFMSAEIVKAGNTVGVQVRSPPSPSLPLASRAA